MSDTTGSATGAPERGNGVIVDRATAGTGTLTRTTSPASGEPAARQARLPRQGRGRPERPRRVPPQRAQPQSAPAQAAATATQPRAPRSQAARAQAAQAKTGQAQAAQPRADRSRAARSQAAQSPEARSAAGQRQAVRPKTVRSRAAQPDTARPRTGRPAPGRVRTPDPAGGTATAPAQQQPVQAPGAIAVGLRGVSPAATNRMPFIILLCGLLGGALASALVISTTLAEGSFEISKLQQSDSVLARQRQQLQDEVAQAQSAPVIQQRAYELGMRPVGQLQFVNLKTGAIQSDAGSGANGTNGVPGSAP